jgi:hypothetical protein
LSLQVLDLRPLRIDLLLGLLNPPHNLLIINHLLLILLFHGLVFVTDLLVLLGVAGLLLLDFLVQGLKAVLHCLHQVLNHVVVVFQGLLLGLHVRVVLDQELKELFGLVVLLQDELRLYHYFLVYCQPFRGNPVYLRNALNALGPLVSDLLLDFLYLFFEGLALVLQALVPSLVHLHIGLVVLRELALSFIVRNHK